MTVPVARREHAEQREHGWLSPLACFSDIWSARPEDEAPDPFRTGFVRDRDRIIHCGAFRRLKDKTQVFVIDEGDFYRTRLTHTLEVVQMARFLGLALRLNDTLTEALALVHDIGHPPFGHEGERILDEQTGVTFNHNSQALRIVDVLESPYVERSGMNLTHVVRRSILKHGGDPGRGAEPMPGLFLEAQIVDLADSTAYQHHDLEDGLRAGILTEEQLAELPIWRLALAEERPHRDGEPGRKAVLSRILKTSLHDIVQHSAEAMARCEAKDAAGVAQLPQRVIGFSPERAGLHAELAKFLMRNFYQHPRVLRSADTARKAIAVLAQHYREHSEELPADYRARIDQDGLGRSVCDYLAGMTDRFAMDEWQRLAAMQSVVEVPEPGPEGLQRIASLERTIGYVFHDKSLAATALTHASARSEEQDPNERLEFLGDSVLGMCVAQDVYQRYPDRQEGELSRIKSSVVSRHALHKVALKWELADKLTLGPGIRSSGQIPPSVEADAVEAVLGCVFIDGGLAAVRRIVSEHWSDLTEAASDRRRSTNHKSLLQNLTQGETGQTPHYEVLSVEGPDHEKVFTVAALVGNESLAVASGRNKRQAEQRAAREALAKLRGKAREEPTHGATAAVARDGDEDDSGDDAADD
jgi:dGTPase